METVFELGLSPETKRRLQNDARTDIPEKPKCERCGGCGKNCQRRPELKQANLEDIPKERLEELSIVWPPVTAYATGNG